MMHNFFFFFNLSQLKKVKINNDCVFSIHDCQIIIYKHKIFIFCFLPYQFHVVYTVYFHLVLRVIIVTILVWFP